MFPCDVCCTQFDTKPGLKQHKKATGHCVCQECRKVLASLKGLQAHKDKVHHHTCPQCPATFSWRALLKNHQKSLNHCYCGDCNRQFSTLAGWRSHMQSSLHSTEFRCCDCNRDFNSIDSLNQHLRDKVHRHPDPDARRRRVASGQKNAKTTASDSASRLECSECRRKFKTDTALQQHHASPAHQPVRLRCIAGGTSCKFESSSPSAQIQHLESGACPSGMNRDKIKALVMEHDIERLITKPPSTDSVLLQEGTESSDSWELIRTPSSASLSSLGSGCRTPDTGSLSDWALLVSQARSRHCPLCPGRRSFRDARSLQDHIQSAAHCEPFIYCPVTIAGSESGNSGLLRAFTTVGGLAQHLESGACVGGTATFVKVVKHLEMRFREFGVNFRLTR